MSSETGANLLDGGLDAEAQAFDRRIRERETQGFVPDLRKLTENDHFYKSFWRDPYFADLYVGEMSREYIRQFSQHLKPGARILDAGCGAGYFALELARSGFDVLGADISKGAIEAASRARDNSRIAGEVISLEYLANDPIDLLDNYLGEFDGILCSGFLHHIPDVESQIRALSGLLRPGGILVMHEPQHLEFTRRDAFWVGIIRELLRVTGNWYQSSSEKDAELDFRALELAVHEEFVTERDPDEPEGQSPNDLSSDREAILAATSKFLEVVHDFPSRSFIYRTLGGLRGDQAVVRGLADLLAEIDEYAVCNGYLNANYFYLVARKRNDEE